MADKMIKCTILRARWDEEGVRHDKGAVVELPAEVAMDAVEAGLVSRVKEAPKKKKDD